MKKHLLFTAILFAAHVSIAQDTSNPVAANQNNQATPNKSQAVLTPIIFFDEHPYNHNMHITSDSSYFYAINGGNTANGQINKFDFTGTLIQTYPITIDGRGLSFNKADGYFYASTYPGDVVKIIDITTGAYSMLFPGAMQNAQGSFDISEDGTKFYDFYQGTLRVHDFNTGAVIDTITGLSYGAGNFGGEAAVAVDSIYIYTWNATIKTVYQHDTSGTLLQSFVLSSGENGHSIAFANDLLFVSHDGNYNIGTWYGYDLSQLSTGITSTPLGSDVITVSPNPFTDELEVQSSQLRVGDEIRITDMLGKTVFTKTIAIATTNFKLHPHSYRDLNWYSGIYFLEVISEKEKIVKKIVKQ